MTIKTGDQVIKWGINRLMERGFAVGQIETRDIAKIAGIDEETAFRLVGEVIEESIPKEKAIAE